MSLVINQPQKLHPFSMEAPAAAIGIPPLSVRLAQAILDLAECTEVDVANSIFVTRAISNNPLAALTGGKPKAVARMVERFEARGLIEIRQERLIIRNPEKLLDIVARFVSKGI